MSAAAKLALLLAYAWVGLWLAGAALDAWHDHWKGPKA